MLVLAGRCGESFMLGDEVQVTVTQISGNQVKLGFSAPPSVRILRAKVWREQQLRRPLEERAAEPLMVEEQRRRTA